MTDARPQALPDLTAEFDAYYQDTRDRLLLQAFALTGDLVAARAGVRDAFVVTWHHWRKTYRLDDPEESIRPQVWRFALRRASARRWRRDKSFDPEVCAILDALSDLSLLQRRLLLLTQLAGVPMAESAREAGVPIDTAERELAAGAASFVGALDLDNSEIPAALAILGTATGSVRWPRVTIIRRAGAARRRAHTVAGAVAVAVALVVTGVAVTDSTGIRPTLHRQDARTPASAVEQPEVVLPETALLTEDVMRPRLGGATWREGRTDDNSEGAGLVVPCQRERYTDPRGQAALVRLFRDGPVGKADRRVVQTAEASRTARNAKRSYRTLRQWLAACSGPEETATSRSAKQQQLVSTYDVSGVGNGATLFVLHSAADDSTHVVGIARTGRLTTTVSMGTPAGPYTANRQGVADLLGDAVGSLCELPVGGRCGDRAEQKGVPALRAGPVPALVSEWDLPAVGRRTGPWAGATAQEIRRANGDIGLVRCSTVSLRGTFRGAKYRQGVARTYVLPYADLPAEFGLTEAAATLPKQRAAGLVEQVRRQINGCPEVDAGAGTDVRVLGRYDQGDQSMTAWRLETELPGDQTVDYDMAVLRRGTAVSVILFVSAPRVEMADQDFVKLSRRALERLGEMPPYWS
jgi:DNA-directed RNA polymerase specialized sigma24 family protein